MIVSPAKLPLLMPMSEQQESQNDGSSKSDFSTFLAEAVNKLNSSQVDADNLSEKFLTGEVDNLHQVTIAMEKAKLSMQLAMQVRNKFVEAYQEISRMQI
ncbi:flagellar hook-basal body complex subunit FliE [Desulfofarcimen acetoxidans DSM 771]|uniref:Flagellar hook-basal body complex protein FliE n=1 Tax=Desulfofarcimen acetoxidans (strain ATCC 49208 / DSM 771 / KCTC 5769 / VKM B-1644 / 5575) TaxID=485916 RepID=C8W1F6_DESAS|nr:flagellar hook-basal body complex protein FliE [Desulfofarcimen acetoxidans]ACV61601.1 flagellar hook-basal body complex subunit FliE [Desulfofarcimen acetoxidans DSM 771]